MPDRVSRTCLVLVAALAVAACADPVEPLRDDAAVFARGGGEPRSHLTTEHRREPFSTVVHACDGDVIAMSGRAHYRTSAFATPGGRVHFQLHTNLQDVSGVGVPSGTRYRLVEVSGAIYNYEAGGLPPFVTNHVLNYRLIGAGPRNDRYVRVRFHLTIAANGTMTVNRLETDAGCEQ